MSNIIESPVVFTNEGMQIIGMLHKPDSVTKPPSVVFFHGCTGSKVENHWLFVKIARALCLSGFMVLRFDFRYSGDSEGNFEAMTLSGEISDGVLSIDYLISDCGADSERIGILGLSMGGAVAAVVAGSLQERIKSCVLMNPVGKPIEDLRFIALSENINVSTFPVECNSFLFGKDFFDDLKHIKPLEKIKKASCPVLVINGSNDKTVQPLRSKEYIDVLNQNDGSAEMCIIEGADHSFSSIQWEREVIDRVKSWFIATL